MEWFDKWAKYSGYNNLIDDLENDTNEKPRR